MPVLAVVGAAVVPLAAMACMLIGGWEIQNGRDGVWLFRVGLCAFLAYWFGFIAGGHLSAWRREKHDH